MRSEVEIAEAAKKLKWYLYSGRFHRQEPATKMNLIGVEAALQWVLGQEDGPVADTLPLIDDMQQIDSYKVN